MRSTLRFALAACVAVLFAACGGDAPESATDDTMDMDAQSVGSDPTAVSLPDTTAEAVIAMLEGADYRARWALWPDKGELYTGQEPHGMLLTTYLNPAAMRALRQGAGTMPVGAVLVKENWMPDSTFAAVTVMVKRDAGWNPAHADWWFMKRLADGTVEAAGRVEGCQNCHIQQATNDYIFTGSLSDGIPAPAN